MSCRQVPRNLYDYMALSRIKCMTHLQKNVERGISMLVMLLISKKDLSKFVVPSLYIYKSNCQYLYCDLVNLIGLYMCCACYTCMVAEINAIRYLITLVCRIWSILPTVNNATQILDLATLLTGIIADCVNPLTLEPSGQIFSCAASSFLQISLRNVF